MRIALGIEYDGHDFFGWQTQENLRTIQGSIESALSKVADIPVEVFCAGRTDAGVHAIGQVIHFDTSVSREMRAWTLGVNSNLPSEIAIKWAVEVDDLFHARFSAIARRYRYVIYNNSLRSAIHAKRVTEYHHPLDITLMQSAGSYLIGEHNFNSFRSSQCESKSPMRNVHEILIMRFNEFVLIEIQANAFLHHMVRNIVGVLMRIGAGFSKPDDMLDILKAEDRKAAAETAPATGLYLTHVFYPSNYAFPKAPQSVLFL